MDELKQTPQQENSSVPASLSEAEKKEKEQAETSSKEENSSLASKGENEKKSEADSSAATGASTSATPTNNKDRKESKDKKKKPKKILSPKQLKKRSIITTSIVVAVSILIGGAGGYMLHHWLNPERTTLSGGATEGVVPTQAEVAKSIQANTLDTDYQPYQLINYSLHLQASYAYSLTLCKGSADTMGVKQNIQSATYSTPNCVFNQNTSSSSVVSTADRYYDYNDGKLHAYKTSKASDWKNTTDVTSTYDEFIQTNGKLFKGSYYCTSDTTELSEEKPVADRYLTDNEADYEASQEKTKHHICGVVIYLIGPRTVKSSQLEKTSDGYQLTLDLYTDSDIKANTDTTKKIASGCSYYAVQMRTTGGLVSRPPFLSSHLVFRVDKDFNLVSSVFTDTYSANIGVMSASMSQTLTQYYFHSDSDTFSSIQVKVPEVSEEDFAGYELFPDE